jgi:GalNAc-alpha-(1->4)-GalNAc-alpha-(1->3)-diNAcBac-PP-undecaprenol alpha-1,4-N-acetyl-D-galactosaminyltransferase
MTNKKHICFILPSLALGGMERVMVELANDFIKEKNATVTFLLLGQTKKFYELDPQINIIEPPFTFKKDKRIYFSFKTLLFTRKTINNLKPDAVLSFGEKWNAFNLLALLFTKHKIFISDRSSPNLVLPFLHKILRKFLYNYAYGIISQTNEAKVKLKQITKHKNIITIGNPVRKIENPNNVKKENIVLNIGRFIPSKQQKQLVEIFSRINPPDWKLVFVGDGKCLNEAIETTKQHNLGDRVVFIGENKNVDEFYHKSKIFAFTSVLEGFPNVLAEALNSPLASIAYNCSAGPSDLIINNYNGFLVNVNDVDTYEKQLKTLIQNEKLRETFEQNALYKMKEFDLKIISNCYYDFLVS